MFFAESDKYESEGAAITGVESKYLYKNGILQTAEDDDVYKCVRINGKDYIIDENGKVQSSTRTKYELEGYNNLWKATFAGTGRTKNYVASWTEVTE